MNDQLREIVERIRHQSRSYGMGTGDPTLEAAATLLEQLSERLDTRDETIARLRSILGLTSIDDVEAIESAVRAAVDAKPQEGPSLRDHYAAAALTGLLSYPKGGTEGPEYVKAAYEYADAMIAAREKSE